jgi:hypothetical protein
MSYSERVLDGAPEGYHYEWVAEERWEVPGDGRKCSKAGCLDSAIALLRRPHRRFAAGFARWGYCAKHLYGLNTIRKIEDGVVKIRRMVKDEAA